MSQFVIIVFGRSFFCVWLKCAMKIQFFFAFYKGILNQHNHLHCTEYCRTLALRIQCIRIFFHLLAEREKMSFK